jgi:hypothetical protein
MILLLVSANVAPSLKILVTLMMEAKHSSETTVLIRAIWHNIPQDGTLPGLVSLSFASWHSIRFIKIFLTFLLLGVRTANGSDNPQFLKAVLECWS